MGRGGEGSLLSHRLRSPCLIQRVHPGGSNLGNLMPVLAELATEG